MPKIIQIMSAPYHSASIGSGTFLHALLDDGSVHFRNLDGRWLPVALPTAWVQTELVSSPTPRQPQRPEWDAFASRAQKGGGILICNCGTNLLTLQQIREHWQQGHFDA